MFWLVFVTYKYLQQQNFVVSRVQDIKRHVAILLRPGGTDRDAKDTERHRTSGGNGHSFVW